jgi:hypothetical protein
MSANGRCVTSATCSRRGRAAEAEGTYLGVATTVDVPFEPISVLVPFPFCIRMPWPPPGSVVVIIRPTCPVIATEPLGVITIGPGLGIVVDVPAPVLNPTAKEFSADRLKIAAAIIKALFTTTLRYQDCPTRAWARFRFDTHSQFWPPCHAVHIGSRRLPRMTVTTGHPCGIVLASARGKPFNDTLEICRMRRGEMTRLAGEYAKMRIRSDVASGMYHGSRRRGWRKVGDTSYHRTSSLRLPAVKSDRYAR